MVWCSGGGIRNRTANSGVSASHRRADRLSRTSSLFEYSEPTLRGAVELAAYVEVAAVLAIAAFIVLRLREGASSTATTA